MYQYMIVGIVLVVATGSSLAGPNTCDYFSTAWSTDSPCQKEDFKTKNDFCNKTQSCMALGSSFEHCYVLWTNHSGNITVMRKGCWDQKEPCEEESSCIANLKRKDKFMFCCCSTDNCNTKFSSLDMPPLKEEEPAPIPEEDNQTLQIFAYVLVPIILFVIIIVVAYCFYKRQKKPFDSIEIASVETPNTTTTAVQSLLLPPEFELPQLIELKARGRYGCVWKAQSQDHYVAVKIFYMQDKKSWQNEQDIFSTEMMHEHPNILHFIAAASRGVGVDAELWLITDFHEKGSLADYLKVETFSLDNALKFMKTMATGLSFLHQDIMFRASRNGYKPAIAHRDLKSKNILIKSDLTACIADFGLAVKFDPSESTGDSHGQVGTRRYMAPEILEGAINFHRDAFLRIDMYAAALIMWEITTRCVDVPGGHNKTYIMPYEEELGQNPTLEQMVDHVVEKKMRPFIQANWRQHPVFGILCETMDDCWDADAEARLSAGCVEERIEGLRNKTAPSQITCYPNVLNSNVITDSLPVVPTPLDTETQNQINAQKNEQFQTRIAPASQEVEILRENQDAVALLQEEDAVI